MESASLWTLSHIAASVRRVTAAPCVTNRESCSTPAGACPANTAAVRSRTRERPTVTARAATPGGSVMQVGFLCVGALKFVHGTVRGSTEKDHEPSLTLTHTFTVLYGVV